MIVSDTPASFEPQQIEFRQPGVLAMNDATLTAERLPFTVRLVQNFGDLSKAVAIRHSAYARHMPEVASTLLAPEHADTEDGTVVLLAESKLDGSPLGSLRIQTNRYKPLSLEKSVDLPGSFDALSLAQVSRLGIAQGVVGRLVKIVLIKASFQYCEANAIDWALVAARSPLDRQYQQLMFDDIFPDAGYIPLAHMDNVPHRMMGFEIGSGQARWSSAGHPLLKFFCNTYHPDILLGQTHEDFRPYGLNHQVLGAYGPAQLTR
jgi:hypothetical protein